MKDTNLKNKRIEEDFFRELDKVFKEEYQKFYSDFNELVQPFIDDEKKKFDNFKSEDFEKYCEDIKIQLWKIMFDKRTFDLEKRLGKFSFFKKEKFRQKISKLKNNNLNIKLIDLISIKNDLDEIKIVDREIKEAKHFRIIDFIINFLIMIIGIFIGYYFK